MQQPQRQEQQRAAEVVLRVDQHKRRVVPGATTEYEELSPPGVRSLAMFRMTGGPGKATAESLRHGGDECFLLLAGTQGVDVEGKRYTLERGDMIFIPRGLVHRGWNAGTDPIDSLFVLSPPEYVAQEELEPSVQREAVVIRANERRRWAVRAGVNATYEELSPPGLASMLLLDVRMEQGPTFVDEVRHGGDENLVCLSGRIDFEVEGTKYVLGPGDSVFTPRGKRHRITNAFQTAEVVFVICPAQYKYAA